MIRPLPILCLHHVTSTGGPHAVSVGELDSLLGQLVAWGYSGLTAEEIASFQSGRRSVPGRAFALTFDDGYRDNLAYAHPILQKYGIPATIFVVTSWVGSGPADRGEVGIPDGHQACIQAIDSGNPDRACLRWSELAAMQTSGLWSVQSHSHTHSKWVQRSGAAVSLEITADLGRSRELIKAHLGHSPRHFAWPWGRHEPDWERAAQSAGFEYLYTLGHCPSSPRGGGLRIPRIVELAQGTYRAGAVALMAQPVLGSLTTTPRRWVRRWRQR